MNWAELSLELGRVVLVRNFIGPSGLVRVVSGPSCPAPISSYADIASRVANVFVCFLINESLTLEGSNMIYHSLTFARSRDKC